MGGLTRGRVRSAPRVPPKKISAAATGQPGSKSNSAAEGICLQLAACRLVAWVPFRPEFLKIGKFVSIRTAPAG